MTTVSGRLVGAELMKIRTTNTWWLFTGGVIGVTALALLTNGIAHHEELYPTIGPGLDQESQHYAQLNAAAAQAPAGLRLITADLMTSGQFLGVLFVLLLGVLVATNEYQHQTATATFVVSPRRAPVLVAKLAAASAFAVLCWLVSTVLDALTTVVFLHSQHVSFHITDGAVLRSVALNLLAYVMWALFGFGLGLLVRSQIGAVAASVAIYLLGYVAVHVTVELIVDGREGMDWVQALMVTAPAVAANVMTTPGQAFNHAPPQWAGFLVMLGYSVVLGVIGGLLTRRRDIS